MLVVDAVNVDVPLPLTDAGLNDPEAPVTNPEAPKMTLPVNPFWPVTVTV
jgi:hypothetical protein